MDVRAAGLAFVHHDSNVVRNVVLSNIYNKVARFAAASSFLISLKVVKNVKASICAIAMVSTSANPANQPIYIYLATSAYASKAFTFFLFFSAIGMIPFRTASRSDTLANDNCSNVRL